MSNYMAQVAPSPEASRILQEPGTEGSAIENGPSLSTRAGINGSADETSPTTPKTAGLDPSEHLIKGHDARSADHERYVKWGFTWRTPLLIFSWALIGIICAIGHHFYYQSLDGTKAGSSTRQSWAVRFGTIFAFLVVASLRASCSVAYKQYIWTLFKRKAFSLDTIDRLFSVPTDPTGFVSWEFIRDAKVAALLAMLCW